MLVGLGGRRRERKEKRARLPRIEEKKGKPSRMERCSSGGTEIQYRGTRGEHFRKAFLLKRQMEKG